MMDRTSIELFKEFVENNTMPQLSSFNMPTLASEMPMETFNSSMKDVALPESPRKEDGDVKTVTEAVMKQEGGASADAAMAIGREWLQNLIYQPGETIPFYNWGKDAINKLVGQLPASAVKDLEFKNGVPYRDGIPLTGQHVKQLYDKVTSHPIYSTLQEAGRKALGAGTATTPQPEPVTAMQKFLYMGGVLKAEEAIPEFIPHPAGLVDADGNPIMIRNEAFKKDFFPQPAAGEGITPQDASGFTERLDTYDPDFEEGGAGTSSRAGGSVGNRTKKKRNRLKSYDD